MHLLVVEDDCEMAAGLVRDLSGFGHSVVVAHDGRDALFIAGDEQFDAIILDRLLPLIDGIDVVKKLRNRANFVPLLMLTALGELVHRIEGLESGADDYLVKPVDPAELNARLHAVVRRSGNMLDFGMVRVQDVEINILLQSAKIHDKPLPLKPLEFRILMELMRNVGNIVTRAMLLENVWGYFFAPDSNIVEMHVHKLRATLKKNGADNLIHTVRGAGYIIYNR